MLSIWEGNCGPGGDIYVTCGLIALTLIIQTLHSYRVWATFTFTCHHKPQRIRRDVKQYVIFKGSENVVN